MQVRYTKWLWTGAFVVTFFAFHERSYAQPCTADIDCDDGNACTLDSCDECANVVCSGQVGSPCCVTPCIPAGQNAGGNTQNRGFEGATCTDNNQCCGVCRGDGTCGGPTGPSQPTDAACCFLPAGFNFCTASAPSGSNARPEGAPCTDNNQCCGVCRGDGTCGGPTGPSQSTDAACCFEPPASQCVSTPSAATECRPSAGVCDPAESCDGTGAACPPDALDAAGTLCRPSAGVCDPAENCDGTNPACPADALEPTSTVCRPTAAKCDSPEACSGSSPDCPPDVSVLGCCVDDGDCPPDPSKCYDSFCNHGDPSDPLDNVCDTAFVPECRVSVSKKGSILYYSKIELKWSVAGTPAVATPIQDTFLTIVNDYPGDVYVQWYFINGDAATAAVFSGAPPVLVERAHKGCNQVDCTTRLTQDESTYMSALSGNPLGCQPFTILDRGPLPGRPDPEAPGQRILRGYAIAFAVDNHGNEISWNHLSGHVDIVNYAERSAWEYNTYAFQCVANVPQGAACSNEIEIDLPIASSGGGTLQMDGKEYEFAFDKLLFDFYAVGSFAFSFAPTVTVQLDTDLTLYPVSVDLRTDDTDSDGPVLTRAKFDIWNQNEDAQSGVNRCINCWDQTLLSNYADENSFLIGNLQTNKGKARIQGIESDDCDAPGACCNLNDDPDCTLIDLERGTIDRDCSEDAALLGVSDKILFFSGAGIPAGARTDAGMTLVGQGTKEAVIKRDLVDPPDPLMVGLQVPDAANANRIDDAASTPVRAPNRNRREIRPGKE